MKDEQSGITKAAELQLGDVNVKLKDALKFGKEGIAIIVLFIGGLLTAITSYVNLQATVKIQGEKIDRIDRIVTLMSEHMNIFPEGVSPRPEYNEPSVSSSKKPPISDVTGYVPQ
jgi:hypothetical protein